MIHLQPMSSKLEKIIFDGDEGCVALIFTVNLLVAVVYLLVSFTAHKILFFHCFRWNQVAARCLTFHSVVNVTARLTLIW